MFSPPPEGDEKGIFLITVAAILISLILVVGYAADSGNIQTAQVKLQEAVDSAALSGARYLALNGGDFSAPAAGVDNDAKLTAQAIGIQTLRLFNQYSAAQIKLPLSNIEVIRQANLAQPALSKLSVKVTARLDVPLYVLKYVPNLGMAREVAATAESDVRPAIVALILDTSGSMGCENINDDCTCLGTGCPNPRISALKNAVNNGFLPKLDATRDIVSVISFNTAAKTEVPPNISGGFDRTAVQNTINLMPAQGATNLCDGLDTAYLAIQPVLAAYPDREVAYVVFSDGAPTAARLRFANPNLLPIGGTRGTHDYYAWAIDWRTPPDLKDDGVSRLSEAPIDLSLCPPPTDPVNCETGVDAPVPQVPPCSTISHNAGDPNGDGDPSDAAPGTGIVEDGATEFGTCLNTFDFFDPGGKLWPAGGGSPIADYRMRFIDCAVASADWMRSQKGVFFPIGLGQPATVACPLEPPAYQCVRDEYHRKDIFLKRIALEVSQTMNFPGFNNFQDLLQDPIVNASGEYFATPNALDLLRIFGNVATRIRLRLID